MICLPAVAVDDTTGMSPFPFYWDEGLGFSVVYGYHKYFVLVVFLMTTKYPLTLHFVTSMVFTFTEFAFIYFNLNAVAANRSTLIYDTVNEYFTAEQKPFSDSFV